MKSERELIRTFLSESVTSVAIKPPEWRLSPGDRMFFSGSCFAAELYTWGRERGLAVFRDPFGPIFNPLSLAECLGRLLSGEPLEAGEFFAHEGSWRHPLFYTLQSDRDRDILMARLKGEMEEARQALIKADLLCLTVGTAWCYRDRQTGRVVNNCHKLPAERFDRFRLASGQSTEALRTLKKKLSEFNPAIRLIVTLSPVRHLRDDPTENSLGKAILRCSLEELRDDDVWYFPAWELMMDELRDYRWYGPDLVHPSDQAVRYILTRFVQSVGSPGLKVFIDEAEKLFKGSRHRPRDPESAESLRFVSDFAERKESLMRRYPELAGFIEKQFLLTDDSPKITSI